MYTLTTNSSSIKRDSDNATIPTDPANRDYQEYLEWLAAGGIPSPPPAAPVIIPDLTPRQVRLVLTAYGLRSAVEAAVLAADQNTKDTWEFSTMIERSNPLLIAMAISLGITSAQLDQLFIAGSKL